jgi:hypothetical protein
MIKLCKPENRYYFLVHLKQFEVAKIDSETFVTNGLTKVLHRNLNKDS